MIGKAEQHRIRYYIDQLLPMLRLQLWDIECVFEEKPDDGQYAAISTNAERHHATVRFADDFAKEDSDRKRWVIIHELVHLHNRKMLHVLNAIEDDFCIQVGGLAWRIFYEQWRVAEEVATDEVARAFLPLAPPWPS